MSLLPPAPGSLAIETRKLTRRFGSLVAVDHLDLSIGYGEIFGFLGPNGAGKSTTIRMLVGVLLPSEGDAWVCGYSVRTEPDAIKPQIGYMSQQFGLYHDLTVEENLEFFARVYLRSPASARWARERVMELLGLAPYRKTQAKFLSGGWKQRLALGCAIVHNPRILFLDEPTAGIDPVARRALWDHLYTLASEGTTLFVTTHYMEEAERCHRIGFMWKGKLVACHTPQGIKNLLQGKRIIAVRGEPLLTIIQYAAHYPWVEDAHLYGSEAHLRLGEGAKVEELIENLRGKGAKILSWEEITPSIEDVFVSLASEG